MWGVLANTWPLLAGVMLLMLGNGIQSTLLGIRGVQENFSTIEISLVMSGYFIGFLGGSRLAPHLIRKVGHVRVFAALGSLTSAAILLFAQFPQPVVWIALRIIIGLCFSGVYVVAESWLNDAATNDTRGQTLSLYVLVQLVGVVAAQGLLNFGDTGGYFLFVLASVLVSLSFTPILLWVGQVPAYATAKPMTISRLVRISPLGAVGTIFLGAVFAAQWGMVPVYGTKIGMSVGEVSALVAALYAGGMALQFPMGWLSDRFDRRKLMLCMATVSAVATAVAFVSQGNFYLLLAAAFVCGSMTNPLYSVLVAHTNDFVDHEDLAAAAGRLVFLNGAGAVCGPLLVGWMMNTLGANGLWIYIGAIMGIFALFCLVRIVLEPLPKSHDVSSIVPVTPNLSPVAHEVAQESLLEDNEGK
ncbi:MAG: MFS transporter [Rhodobacteraceae bacterium]|nr:MFS transporter [Paracoccaceae bacterium]